MYPGDAHHLHIERNTELFVLISLEMRFSASTTYYASLFLGLGVG